MPGPERQIFFFFPLRPLPTTGRPERRCRAGMVALVLLGGLLVYPAIGQSQEKITGGTIQWAQTILNEKGFEAGRPNGQMTAKTRTALQAYQKSVGLPASGDLDQTTIAKMMEGRKQHASVRELGAPDPSRPRLPANAPEPKPQAAPTTRVEGSGQSAVTGVIGQFNRPGSSGGGIGAASGMGGIGGIGGMGGSGSLSAEPAPVAAPRLGVSAQTASGASVPPSSAAAIGGDPGPLQRPTAPLWVHLALGAGATGMLGAAGWWWWNSGRRGPQADDARIMTAEENRARRLPPTLGSPPVRSGRHSL